MNTTIAYKRVFKFINDERRMREYVFRNAPLKIDAKLNDADEALSALEWLRQAASVPNLDDTPMHTQERMF